MIYHNKRCEFDNLSLYVSLKDGLQTRFWKDLWMGNIPLAHQYPVLYDVTVSKNIAVAETLAHNLANFSFRRTLIIKNLNSWSHLCLRCSDLNLSSKGDVLLWKFSQNKQFSVHAMHSFLINSGVSFPQKSIWQIKIR